MPLQITPVTNADKWRVVNYLQSDAERQGVLSPAADGAPVQFMSFWHNLHYVVDKGNYMFVAKNDVNALVGYMVLNRDPTSKRGARKLVIDVVFLEVCYMNRKQGVGREMVQWLEAVCKATGHLGIKVQSIEDAVDFWLSVGFCREPAYKRRDFYVFLYLDLEDPDANAYKWDRPPPVKAVGLSNSDEPCDQCSTQIAVFVCGKCSTAKYCSKNCQWIHWEEGKHSKRCRDE